MSKHAVPHIENNVSATIEIPDDNSAAEQTVTVTVTLPRSASPFHIADAIQRAGRHIHRIM